MQNRSFPRWLCLLRRILGHSGSYKRPIKLDAKAWKEAYECDVDPMTAVRASEGMTNNIFVGFHYSNILKPFYNRASNNQTK
jgi:hypothetical protein